MNGQQFQILSATRPVTPYTWTHDWVDFDGNTHQGGWRSQSWFDHIEAIMGTPEGFYEYDVNGICTMCPDLICGGVDFRPTMADTDDASNT